MNHWIIRIVVAISTLAIGTTATLLPTTFRSATPSKSSATPVSRLAEEKTITGIVLLHLAQSDPAVEKSNYYVSSYNYADPSGEVMSYLTGNGVHAEPLSQLPYDSMSYREVSFLRVGTITWLSNEEIIVAGSVKDGCCHYDARAYLFHLVREAGDWRITSAETIT